MDVRRIDYPDGGWCEQQYVGGRLNGLWTVYYSNGRKKWERQHRAGRQEGYSREWDRNGRLREEQFYHLDVLHGPWRRWDARGREELVGEFAFGRRIRDPEPRPASELWAQLLPCWEDEPARFRDRLDDLERALARPTCRFGPDDARPFEDVFGESYFGHVNVIGADDEWPAAGGVPLTPILQLDCTRLPAAAPALAGVRLLTVFAPPTRGRAAGTSSFGTTRRPTRCAR